MSIFRILIAALLALAVCAEAGAAASAVTQTDHLRSRILAAGDAAVPGGTLRLGLWLDHDPHWHTYWKNPGDSGLPTKLELRAPAGLQAGAIRWPLPQRLPVDPLMNYGYDGAVLLPFEVRVPASISGDTLDLRIAASWLICEVECIPGKAEYALTLPLRVSANDDAQWREVFAKAEMLQPQPAPDTLRTHYVVTGETVWLRFDGAGLPEEPAGWTLFPATTQLVVNAATPSWTRDGEGWRAATAVSEFFDTAPERFELLLSNGERGIDIIALREGPAAAAVGDSARAGNATTAPSSPGETPSLWLALVFAFLGGVILNLMPCVFPILSIKALGALESARDQAALRRHGLFYAIGVIASFLVVAAVLIGLRASGQQLGWGFQLQNPAFVAAIALLLFAMALSFAGVVELGGRLAGVGQRLTEGGGARSTLFTGVLACVVASPCTAPFMGTALGYALAQPAYVALSVFVALGLGLAAPMLMLGYVPGFARLLPRPGAWMEGFRQFLAFPLLLTVVWLLWVYGQQTSMLGAVYFLAALVGVAFALWLFGRQRGRRGAWPRTAQALAGLVLLVCVATPLLFDPPADPAPDAQAVTTHPFEPWSVERLAALRAEGHPVLVNMTAAWCISCLVNEHVVLSSQRVRDALVRHHVAYLKGDWTRYDADITQYLESFGRSGVPLYLLYPAGGGEPRLLPQLLTPDIITAALEEG